MKPGGRRGWWVERRGDSDFWVKWYFYDTKKKALVRMVELTFAQTGQWRIVKEE